MQLKNSFYKIIILILIAIYLSYVSCQEDEEEGEGVVEDEVSEEVITNTEETSISDELPVVILEESVTIQEESEIIPEEHEQIPEEHEIIPEEHDQILEEEEQIPEEHEQIPEEHEQIPEESPIEVEEKLYDDVPSTEDSKFKFGVKSEGSKYQYIVQVRRTVNGKLILCSGALINEQWVITNRQCFSEGGKQGKIVVNNRDEYTFSTVTFASQYPSFETSDLSVIKLDTAVEIKGSKRQISLVMSAVWPPKKRYDRPCMIAYYWHSEEDPNRINFIETEVSAGSGPSACNCELSIKRRGPSLGLFQKEAICVFGRSGTGCYAFTSSLLYCDRELVGIGHLVYGCTDSVPLFENNKDNCNKTQIANTYTNLYSYVEWIRSLGIELRKEDESDYYDEPVGGPSTEEITTPEPLTTTTGLPPMELIEEHKANLNSLSKCRSPSLIFITVYFYYALM